MEDAVWKEAEILPVRFGETETSGRRREERKIFTFFRFPSI